MKNKYNFSFDNEWGTYWEFELNRFIEPYFNSQLEDKFISFTTLRSSDIFKDKKDWYKFDTLYSLYEKNNKTPLKQITFEIKADKYRMTGNICIEKKYKNKLSGVFHTEANYFIYYLPRYEKDNLYIFKPNDLVNFLNNEVYNNYLKESGDGGNTLCYIINKKQFDIWVTEKNLGKIETFNTEIPEKFNIQKF